LLNNLKFSDLKQVNGPHLLIGATDLYNGASVAISADGIFIKRLIRPLEKDDFSNINHDSEANTFPSMNPSSTIFLDIDQLVDDRMIPSSEREGKHLSDERVSKLVAASGAFPAAFNAKEWEPLPRREFLLADGGLTDNSAINLLLNANEVEIPEWQSDFILSSDASALFEGAREVESLLQITRAIDVVYANTGIRRYDSDAKRKKILLLSPAIFFPEDQLSMGQALSPYKDPNNIWKFLYMYLRSKTLSEPLDFADLELLISSLPETDLKSRAIADLNNLKQNGFQHEQLNTLTGRAMQRRLPELEKEVPELERRLAKRRRSKSIIDRMFREIDETSLSMLRNELQRARESVPDMMKQQSMGKFSDILANDLKECIKVFRNTSTLQDRFSEHDVKSLFRLGQYLVVLNWPMIQEQLNELKRVNKAN
jgi:hypothetical protein